MQKAPNRPNNLISQTFNDGVVTVYAVQDTAAAGYKPTETLRKKGVLRFAERRLGIERYYSGRQNQIEISRVIRVQKNEEVNSQDVAIIKGMQYRIHLVQHVFDIYPPCMDLSLSLIQQQYDIEAEGQ